MKDSGYTYEPVRDIVLDAEVISTLEDLGNIFRHIHRRLESEGYVIENGIIKKIDRIDY